MLDFDLGLKYFNFLSSTFQMGRFAPQSRNAGLKIELNYTPFRGKGAKYLKEEIDIQVYAKPKRQYPGY